MSELIPERGTDEHRWWLAGAKAEAAYIYEGMGKDGREMFELVKVMAQQGDSADDITDMVAGVGSCEWSLRPRLALAWRIVWWPIGNAIRTRRQKARGR